jgi:membrane-bound lytic murein transglycosylase B
MVEASAMFELFSGDGHRALDRSSVSVLVSTAAHVIVVGWATGDSDAVR